MWHWHRLGSGPGQMIDQNLKTCTMKAFKSIILVIALLTGISSFANEGTDAKSMINASVQHELKSRFSIKIERSEKVKVVFTTDANGKVNLAIANTKDPELKKAIESSFLQMEFKLLKADVAYGITLNLTRI
jgi:hypothetical protein